MNFASPPCCLTMPAVASPAATSRSTTAIFAPALAKASAAARPMPPPPPVIRATLPVKSMVSSLVPKRKHPRAKPGDVRSQVFILLGGHVEEVDHLFVDRH